MKKVYLFIAGLPLLAFLAAGCAKERVESRPDGAAVISFKAAAGKQTAGRASETTIENLRNTTVNGPLTVRAYKDGDGAVTAAYRTFELTYDNTVWSYGTTPVYHPSFGLTHYSIYPLTGITPAATYDATGEKMVESFAYTVGATAAEQVDLLVATASTTNADATSATATLAYSHILSQVNFAIQGVQGAIIAVSGIQITGVQYSGTYTFGSPGAWSPDPNASPATANYTYTSPVTATTDGLSDNILYLGNTGGSGAGSDNANDNALMLMPQSFASSTAALSFTYRINNSGGGEVIASTNVEKTFTDLGITSWEPGKRYLYILTFDLNAFSFTVTTVEDWQDDPAGVTPVKP